MIPHCIHIYTREKNHWASNIRAYPYKRASSLLSPITLASHPIPHIYSRLRYFPLPEVPFIYISPPTLYIRVFRPMNTPGNNKAYARARARNGRFLPKNAIESMDVVEVAKVCGWCLTNSTTQWRFGPSGCSKSKFIPPYCISTSIYIF